MPKEIEIREFNVQTGEVNLFVRVAGNLQSGQALIAINGGPGLSSHYMLNLENLAGESLVVVTYDQRGVSRSSAPPMAPTSYTLDKYVDDLEAIRKAIGFDKVHLFGHSWGGLVALHYASVYPEQVRSMVLFGSGAPAWKDIIPSFYRFEARVNSLQTQGIIPQDLTQKEGQDDPRLPAYFSDPKFYFSPDDKGKPPEFNQGANQLTWAAIQGYDLTNEVANLHHPILVMCGKDDPFGVPLSEAVVAALTTAKVEYIVLENCGHFWHECPSPFFSHFRDFLKASGSGN